MTAMAKILIVEDEESILMALEDNLSLEGYEVESAKDGEQGFSRAKEGRFDLIILDIMLPRMDGFDVCRQLRQAGDYPDVLVRFSTQSCKLIFWRGTGYVPCWVTENRIWYTNEWTKTWGKDVTSCAEPLMDRDCRFSHVRIIENTPARTIVHWRYTLWWIPSTISWPRMWTGRASGPMSITSSIRTGKGSGRSTCFIRSP
jgi:hypothetical protein